ncbi:MAG: hypothetical protein V3W18_01525 [candidate division Zixibacteria bacterium]
MNLNAAIEKINTIKSRIDTAFEKGEIDFDRINSDLETLKGDLKLIMKRDEKTGREYMPGEFIPRQPFKINDFR